MPGLQLDATATDRASAGVACAGSTGTVRARPKIAVIAAVRRLPIGLPVDPVPVCDKTGSVKVWKTGAR